MQDIPNEVVNDDDFEPDNAVMERLKKQQSASTYLRTKLNKDSQKNWNLFYKRHGDRFFRNRFWIRKDFYSHLFERKFDSNQARYLLEIGCGCGDFVLPILQDLESSDIDVTQLHEWQSAIKQSSLSIYCCDYAPNAIQILQAKELYKRNSPAKIKAFVYDITSDDSQQQSLANEIDGHLMHVVSMIFVLSSLEPEMMARAIANVTRVMSKNGIVLVRDYAIYDSTMLRFKESAKLDERFYYRQDGTRAYFFTKFELIQLFEQHSGRQLKVESIAYVKRVTENNSTSEKYPRVFLQATFTKVKEN